MSPEKTIARMATSYNTPDLASNRIIKVLSRLYGGMNEILSLVEVQMQFDSGKYDVIVLDTPPGAHFLDFLESLGKIRSFFDQNFVEIFNYLGQKTANAGKKVFSFNIINKVISGGVKKLLSYLQKVTGAQFIDDFIQAVQIIYQSKEAFLKGLSLQDRLKEKTQCNWFLVTSVEQGNLRRPLNCAHMPPILFIRIIFLFSINVWRMNSKTGNRQKKNLRTLRTQSSKERAYLKQNYENHSPKYWSFLKSPVFHLKTIFNI